MNAETKPIVTGYIFSLRCSDKAHPQIREILIPLRKHMATVLPEIFSET